MKSTFRALGQLMLGTVIAVVVAWPAHAQSLSSRPIRLILPYTTGGPVDMAARILLDAIAQALRHRPAGREESVIQMGQTT